jgi:hypothetical protein
LVPESKKWELKYIANMPCQLLSKYGFTPTKGMKPGRVLFVANGKGLIRHVVVGLPPESNPHSTEETNEIFHCSQANNGGKIETLNELFAKCNKKKQRIYHKINLPFILSQMDRRSTDPSEIAMLNTLAANMVLTYVTDPSEITMLAKAIAASKMTYRPSNFSARLVTCKPAEEMKENDPRITVVIPRNVSFGNLAKCSPIYLFEHGRKGSQSDLHMLDRTPEGSPRSRSSAFQCLSLNPARGSQADLTMLDRDSEVSPRLRSGGRLGVSLRPVRGSQVDLTMLESPKENDAGKSGS